jgi:hypothetical protein
MKKEKFLVVGLIALLMAGGLFLASCGEDKGNCPNGENNCRAVESSGLQSKECSNLCVYSQQLDYNKKGVSDYNGIICQCHSE